MNKPLPLFLLALSLPSWGHDGGHGPKLTDVPPHGGIMAPVIDAKEAKLGPKAKVVYKAELLRAEDGSMTVYLYDIQLNPLDLAAFDTAAKGILEIARKGKLKITPFSVSLKDGVFSGTPPKPSRKPYNIDVRYMEKKAMRADDAKAKGKKAAKPTEKDAGKRELLSAFDNLD